MGCHPSKVDFPQDAPAEFFRPPAPIPVMIGSAVQQSLRMNTDSIVFIFGGPASKKGMIIEEMTTTFGFHSISVEDIVFSYLPNRLQNIEENSINAIVERLKADDGILTIDWILETISGIMARQPNQQRFVIDIIPTITVILKAEQYMRRSHTRQLEEFERTNPIAFAIDVNVRDEDSILRANGESKGEEKRFISESNGVPPKTDDVDRNKLEKRIAEYHTCAEPFLSYFRQKNRIVHMALTTEAVPNLVNTTKETLQKLGFTMKRRDDHVICFTTDENISDIDLAYYKLKVLNASEISRAADTLATQIVAVYRKIANSPNDDNFLVVIPTFRAQVAEMHPQINFSEPKVEVYLDEFIKNKQHDKPPKFRPRITIRRISSSRQSFVFFDPFPENFANYISLVYLNQMD